MKHHLKDIDLTKRLMDHIKDNIYFMDREGRVILINQAGAEWLGFKSPAEVIGKTDIDLFTSEHGRQAYEDEQKIMQTGVPVLGLEEKETWADGSETWVSTSKMPLLDDDEEIVGIFGISRDITEHKQSEIQAARYAEENLLFRKEIEEELRMAAGLQKAFFPSSYPVFPDDAEEADSPIQFQHYYHPGGLMGGDFCYICKLSETEAAIFLCDVMGHGVRASLGTAIVRAMVEDLAHREQDPARFLSHMNKALMPILRQDDLFLYATACYLIVDVSTGAVRYANAGHPFPIHLDGGSGCANWCCEDRSFTGPALAITEDAEYRTKEGLLKPGDAVVMFTDGIYEVSDSEQEEFGEDRLVEAAQRYSHLPMKDLFPALLDEAHRFSAEGELDDDVCLVGFKLRELLKV